MVGMHLQGVESGGIIESKGSQACQSMTCLEHLRISHQLIPKIITKSHVLVTRLLEKSP